MKESVPWVHYTGRVGKSVQRKPLQPQINTVRGTYIRACEVNIRKHISFHKIWRLVLKRDGCIDKPTLAVILNARCSRADPHRCHRFGVQWIFLISSLLLTPQPVSWIFLSNILCLAIDKEWYYETSQKQPCNVRRKSCWGKKPHTWNGLREVLIWCINKWNGDENLL